MAKSSKDKKNVRNAGSALDMLVRQFSQPLACLRELIQNAIDAGSNLIEVTLVQDPELRCLKLSVADTGEGMTEAIIQTQLTRLFSSSKENDLTKVGKFGIGFVSVFSLEPEAVVVDTGREGQSWRVLFDKDRKFDLIALPHSVDGTTVSLCLAEGRYKLPALLEDVEKTLAFWCRHCKAEIRVNGKSIKQPFELEAAIQVYHEEPGTRLVVAATTSKNEFFGYYNQGLTLLEGTGSPIPHLSFKVDSRYFEHTLTRDNIIRDEDYDKAMTLLRRVVRQQYPQRLFEELRGPAGEESAPWQLLSVLPDLGVDPQEIAKAPLFVDHDQQYYSVSGLQGCQVHCQEQPDALQKAVHDPKQKRIVLRHRAGHPGMQWLRQHLTVFELSEEYALCEAQPGETLKELLAACSRLGAPLGARSLTPVRWLHHKGEPPFLRRAQPGLVRLTQAAGASDPVLLNVDHSVYPSLQQLAQWSPPLAGQVVLQYLLLQRPEKEREALSQGLTQGVLEQLA
jgi:hypothetical protein